MKAFYNDQAKPLLKFFTKTKSELVNLKLKQILNEGFISKPQGIFLKAAIRKRQKFEQNKTQNEWSINEIVVFESEYESSEEYFSDMGSFVMKLASKFRESDLGEEIVLAVSFQALQFVTLDREEFKFIYEDYDESTNAAHIKIYAKRENDEILLYKDRIGGYKTEALIVFEVASSSQDT
ncbi:L-cystine-binding protein TcyA [Campylobacter concisus]|uniref:L-cystine-binding protein TcyA n=1 Tax=Campylobacter concisus TaxID=199 RepID=UPI000D659E94|nr:L-cystine-binding protein TcyA [Campylobacter concisus]